jgi:hypothetical protein
MKAMILAATAAVSLGIAATASAQGLPYGTVPPVYGAHAFPNEPYHTGTVFSELYHNVFGHSNNGSAVAVRAPDRTITPVKGG